VLLVMLIELLQLFTGSHVFETADIVMRSVLVLLGALSAGMWSNHAVRLDVETARVRQVALVGFALAVQVALLLATVQVSFSSMEQNGTAARQLMPFESLWRAPVHLAVTDMITTGLTYGLLAATITLLLATVSRRPTGPMVCLIVSSLAMFVAIARAVTGQASLDVTDAVIATLAAFAAVELLGHGGERRRRPAPVAEALQ
jgi:hypothetical protein